MKQRNKTHLTRLIRLMRLQDQGLLKNKSYQEIANLLPDQPSRATVMRNLRQIEDMRDELEEFAKQISED